jgi:N-acetylglutamate synthase-like GNAT family acetyltransferase
VFVGAEFIPGEYWTRERAVDAARRMSERLASADMQAVMEEIAEGASNGDDPAALAASLAATAPASIASPTPARAGACTYRRGRPADVPRFAELIIAGELPPMFIEEFVEGFVAAEHEGAIVGCGGLEVYGDCGVIRSVVVEERARGLRIGERMAELLMDDARAAGVNSLYLFTMHARPFWRRLGFVDAALDAWRDPPRVSWQYQFISQHPEAAGDVFSMWRAASPKTPSD